MISRWTPRALPFRLGLLGLVVAPACSDEVTSTDDPPADVVATLSMRPSQMYIDTVGVSIQAYAIAYAEDGRRLYSSAENPNGFSWSSSAPEVASVDENGLVNSVSWGHATLAVTHQAGPSGTIPVTVRDAVDLAWSIPNMGVTRAGIAVAADGTIYVAATTRLHAISPQGVILWTLDTPGGVLSTPAIGTDGTLYFGSTSGGGLTAVRPDGTVRWVLSDIGSVSSSPAVGQDGTIHVARGQHVYGINPEGEILWTYETTGRFTFSSPAIARDGTIYVGDSENVLHAIGPDGSPAWTFGAGDQIQQSPSIGEDGTIYFGSYDHRLYAVSPDGTERWDLPVHVNSSPSIGRDGTIYVGGWGVSAIDRGGSIRWTYAPNGGWIRTVLGADGTAYVANTNGLVVSALDPEGRLLWEYPTGSLAGGAPAIGADGTILATSEDGTLYALIENGSTNRGYAEALWPKERGDRANTGRAGG